MANYIFLTVALLSGTAVCMERVETIRVPKSVHALSVQSLPEGVIRYLQKLPRMGGSAASALDKADVILQFITRFSPAQSYAPWR